MGGGVLRRNAQCEGLTEVLDQPHLWHAQPVKPRYVLTIDHKRNVLLARRQAGLLGSDQTPGLAEEYRPAAIQILIVGIKMPHARRKAAALIVVAIGRRTAEVRFNVGFGDVAWISGTLSQCGDSTLSLSEVEFREVVVV